MSKHANAWTKSTLGMIPLFFVIGCATAPSGSAICDGTRAAISAHAAALANEASDAAVITGAQLISLIDAGCRS
jgi:hypothetical protein